MNDSKRRARDVDSLQPVAGNGLLDRRALLGGGMLFAGAAAAGVGGSLNGAAAEPLADDPWSLATGSNSPAYEQRSKYEAKVLRILSNPNGEPRTQPHRESHGFGRRRQELGPGGAAGTSAEGGNVQPLRAEFVAHHGQTKIIPQPTGFPSRHYNSLTSRGIDGKGEVKPARRPRAQKSTRRNARPATARAARVGATPRSSAPRRSPVSRRPRPSPIFGAIPRPCSTSPGGRCRGCSRGR